MQDNVTSVTDARNHTTSSVFDDFGNERSVVSPDSGTTSSIYDAAGNLSCQTNAKNETVTISWDALNRPTQVSWPNAARNTVLVWDQNRIGTLSGIQEEEFERAFTYDSLGQVTAETIAFPLCLFTTFIASLESLKREALKAFQRSGESSPAEYQNVCRSCFCRYSGNLQEILHFASLRSE